MQTTTTGYTLPLMQHIIYHSIGHVVTPVSPLKVLYDI